MKSSNLILILGDQLSTAMSSLNASSQEHDVVLMAEVADEATYVHHHKKKIAFLFSAMRHFAIELENAGWKVDYVNLDDTGNTGCLKGEVRRALSRHKLSCLSVTEPGEWRLADAMQGWSDSLECDVTILPDQRFLAENAGAIIPQ